MYLLGMIGLLFFSLTVLAGWAVACRFRPVLAALEAAVAAPVIGVVLATWFALLAYLLVRNIDLAIGLTALFLLAVTVVLKPWKEPPDIERKHLPGIFGAVAAAFIFMYYGLLNFYDGEYHIAFPLFGDAAFHTAIVTSFSHGYNYLPQYPFMAGQLLRYTFLIDFYSALLDRLGMGLQWSIVLPGIALLASLLALLYFLGVRFTGRRAGGFLTMTLLVFSGGLEFLQAFADWQASGLSLQAFLGTAILNYTTMYDYNFVFTNFIIIVMAQRAALLGFGAGALLILLFYSVFVDKHPDSKKVERGLIIGGALVGFLPLFHTYSYICIMVAATLLFALYGKRSRLWAIPLLALSIAFTLQMLGSARADPMQALNLAALLFYGVAAASAAIIFGAYADRHWFYFMPPAVIFAVPQAVYIYSQMGSSFLRIEIGWMAGSIGNLPAFWLVNMGLGLLLLIAGVFVAGRKKALFYLPFLAIFVLANVVVFQPWDYDNHKFFSFWLMPSTLFMAFALLEVFKLRFLGKPLFALLLIGTIMTGLLVGYFMVARPYVEFSQDQIFVAGWIDANTPPDAVFLTGDSPTHPAISLAGRLSYLGYYPWMYTHGIDTDGRVREVKEMYNAASMEALQNRLAAHDIDYVYLGPEEAGSGTYKVNYAVFDSLTPVFNHTSAYGQVTRIYKVN